MSKRNRPRQRSEQGSLLAGAFLVSMALATALVALLSFSHMATHQAESILSRSQLSRMAQEKFTRDILALNKNIDPTKFDTGPVHFTGGEAQSSLQRVPGSLKKFESSLYLVTVATLTKESAPAPRHMSLETLIEFAPPPPPAVPAPAQGKIAVSKYVEDQLRAFLPETDPRFEEVKQQILSDLEDQIGSNLDSISVNIETNQYRDPMPTKPAEGDFYLSPISVEPAKTGPRVQVWKERYY